MEITNVASPRDDQPRPLKQIDDNRTLQIIGTQGKFGPWFRHRRVAWAIAIVAVIWPVVTRVPNGVYSLYLRTGSSVRLYEVEAFVVLILLVLSCIEAKITSSPKRLLAGFKSAKIIRPGFLARSQGDPLYPSAKSTTTFYRFWLAILVTWILFYALEAWHNSVSGSSSKLSAFDVWLFDLVNTLEAVFFFAAYFEMAKVTFSGAGKRERSAFERLAIIFICYGLFVAAELTFFMFRGGPTSPNWWSVISGLAVGVSMALLVGRFESRFIAAPLPLTALAFLYAVLQVTYPLLLESDPIFAMIVTWFSLPLKIVIFLLVDWMYSGGKLFYYMVREREIKAADQDAMTDDWDSFWNRASRVST